MAVSAETSGATALSLKRKSSNAPPSSSKKKIRRTFKKLEIEGDGNCLFRAFSHHFNGTENEYEGVRNRIVKYVEKNWEQFHSKVESVLSSRLARSARQYASYMGKDKTFGSEVEILAASLLFKTPIRVYLKKAKRFLPTYQSGDNEGLVDIQRVKEPNANDGDAHILYLEYDEDNLHYNVLVPILVETQVLSTSMPTSTASASSASATAPQPVSISTASPSIPTPSATFSSFASPDLVNRGSSDGNSNGDKNNACNTIKNNPSSSQTPKKTDSSATEPRVTPKALFINKTFDRLENDSVLSTASSVLNSSSHVSASDAKGSGRNGSRGGTPTRGSSSGRDSAKASSKLASNRQNSSGSVPSPIVVRDCYVSLPRTPNSTSRRGSNDSGNFPASYRQQQHFVQQQPQQQHRVKSRPVAPARVMALCLCSTRDPAFIGPVTRAAKRHLSQYEVMRKRQTSHRVTRMRGLDPDADQEPSTVNGGVEGDAERSTSAQPGSKTPYSKEIVLWPYLLHSLPQCPNEVFLYHLLFCLFAASQEADEAFSVLARHVFYLQREEIDKYMTAYNLEFTCHTGDTLEKILSHYRKSLKRDVTALRKEWVDMYFAHEEIDHPCKPTDLSARQNCVIFVLDSRHEEHQRLLSRLSDHLPYLWKRLSTPLVDPNGIPSSIELTSLNSIVDLAVDTVCNDFVDSIIHQHPTNNSITREIRILTHQIAVATENSFQLSIYPKDSLLIDSDVTSSKICSLFLLRDRLLELARQSEDLLDFERHQIIGDRVADTHLLEKASSRHRIGICLPTEEWVEASVFFEKALADLLYSMRTSASNDADRGFLFLPALNRGRRPFHPFVDGAPLRRLARENNYRVEILTAAAPVKEPVSIVLILISKLGGASKVDD